MMMSENRQTSRAPGLALVVASIVVAGGACEDDVAAVADAGPLAPPDAGTPAPPQLDEPVGVQASRGDDADTITVVWEPVSGAASYDLYRDGVLIAADLTVTTYEDVDASPGGVPGAPLSLSASDGTLTDGVELTWQPALPPAGGEHEYRVRAKSADTESELSLATVSSRGYRAGSPVTDYELSIDDGATWFAVGGAPPFRDVSAPPSTIAPGAAKASNGTSRESVALSLVGATSADGAPQSYRLRGVNAAGAGAASIPESGHRGAAALAYQWERSDGDADGAYAALPGATTASFVDETAPADGAGRFYRCVVSSEGAASATSTPDRGHRYAGVLDEGLPELWTIHGPVETVSYANDALYVGGDFDHIGPRTGSFAAVDAATGQPDLLFARVSDLVSTAEPDGAGGWYIAGFLDRVDGVPCGLVARIDANGELDDTFAPEIAPSVDFGGFVSALAVSAGTVYIGGSFTSVGGQPRQNIAALDASTGAVTAWDPGADAVVDSLLVDGATIYASGAFENIGGQPRNYLAAIDASTGDATPWNPNPDEIVRAMALDGDTLFVGGPFTNVGGRERDCLAAIDTSTGNARLLFNVDVIGCVNTIAIDGDTLYIGGTFGAVAGQLRSRIAAVDTTFGLPTPWNPTADSDVSVITLSGGTVYVGGGFRTIGGAARNYIAALDATTGAATPWDPNAATSVLSIDVSGGKVFVGGLFRSIGGVTRNHIGAIDLVTGVATDWDPNANGSVHAFAMNVDRLYAAGSFLEIGGQARSRLAELDLATGIATTWDPGANERVDVLTLSGDTIYAGGVFTEVGGATRNHIVAIDAASADVSAWDGNADDVVRAIAVDGERIYVAGWFTQIGGAARNYLAALDATTGGATSWNPDANDDAWAIAVDGGTVYAGGSFFEVGGLPRSGIAALDAVTGQPTAWNPGVFGGFPVRSLLVRSGLVYATGDFRGVATVTRPSIAEIDAEDGLPTAWTPNCCGGDVIVQTLDGDARLFAVANEVTVFEP